MMRKNFTAKAKTKLSIEDEHHVMKKTHEKKQRELLYVQ
jgi:hypothetical protein